MTNVNEITKASEAGEQWECFWIASGHVIYDKHNGKDGGHTYQREVRPEVSATRMCTSIPCLCTLIFIGTANTCK